MALTEQDIIDTVYALYETDTFGWATDDEEYLAARKYCNIAIAKWERYDNTEWRDLWTKLSDAVDGDKTLTASTYAYDCPTNFIRPSSWVRTGAGSNQVWWEVFTPAKLAKYSTSTHKFCYFSGNIKDGFTLNFNPNVFISTGDTISYEYYKSSSTFTTTTSTTEVPDAYYIIYFVLARFLHNDEEDNTEELQEADDRLENMRVVNMSGYFEVQDNIEESANIQSGINQ